MLTHRQHCIFLLFLLPGIAAAQVYEVAWYDQSVHEEILQQQQVREYRANLGLKNLKIQDEINEISSEEKYDREGRSIYFLSYHFSSYKEKEIHPDKLLNRKLKNEWSYFYDENGNLIKAVNEHESISGTRYGGDGMNSLPAISGPWKLITLHSEKTWKYKFDEQGNMTEQLGLIFPEPYRYHRTNNYRVYDDKSSFDWRYVFKYGEEGKLKERMEYRTDIERPVYNRIFLYDTAGRIIRETVYSGDNINKNYYFQYDEKGRMIERKNEQYGDQYLFSYDKNGNLIKTEKYNSQGKLVLTQLYDYNEKNLLITKDFIGLIVNHAQEKVRYQYELDSRERVVKKIKIPTDTSNAKKVIYTYEYY